MIDLRSNSRTHAIPAVLLRIFSFLPLVAICHSLGSRVAQLEPCTFDRKVRKLYNDDVMHDDDHENIDLRSPNLHLK